MAGKSILMGTSTRYDAGTQTIGAPPALASLGVNDGVFPRALRNKCKWTNPTDTFHSASLLYRFLRTNPAVQQAFNGAASPYRNVGKLDEFRDDVDPAPPGTVVYDYYLVTIDKYGYPLTRTSANALYLGHA